MPQLPPPLKPIMTGIKVVMLTSATIHMVILIGHALLSGNYQNLNLVNILTLQLVSPNIPVNNVSFLVGAGISLALFTIIYWRARQHSE